jgi:hypothetical protein
VYAGEVEVLSANTALLRIPDPGDLGVGEDLRVCYAPNALSTFQEVTEKKTRAVLTSGVVYGARAGAGALRATQPSRLDVRVANLDRDIPLLIPFVRVAPAASDCVLLGKRAHPHMLKFIYPLHIYYQNLENLRFEFVFPPI